MKQIWDTMDRKEKQTTFLIVVEVFLALLIGILIGSVFPIDQADQITDHKKDGIRCGEDYTQRFEFEYTGTIDNWNDINATPTLFVQGETVNTGIIRLESEALALEQDEPVEFTFTEVIYAYCFNEELRIEKFFINERITNSRDEQ